MSVAQDHQFMAQALRLAEQGLYTAHPNPRVGCVLVRDAAVLAAGWHARTGGPHAEIVALQQVGHAAQGATAYVTLEPCCHQGRTPPCSDALIKAGVTRVVVAMQDPNPHVAGQGLQALRDAGIQVQSGVLEAQARALNPGFVSRMEKGRPYIRIKMGMSLDGRTAMASGESKWITGAAARSDVQRLRARSSAIMTGIETVLLDDPSLNVRLENTETLQPLRIVADSQMRMPASARMLTLEGDTLVATTAENVEQTKALQQAGAEVVQFAAQQNELPLAAVMAALAKREVNELLVEAGARLSGAFMQAGLVDEVVIYMAPVLMGHAARPLFELPGLEKMADKIALQITDARAVGEDWRITMRPRNHV